MPCWCASVLVAIVMPIVVVDVDVTLNVIVALATFASSFLHLLLCYVS
jgi:hypothetical protein